MFVVRSVTVVLVMVRRRPRGVRRMIVVLVVFVALIGRICPAVQGMVRRVLVWRMRIVHAVSAAGWALAPGRVTSAQ